jgi:hypothetical protein
MFWFLVMACGGGGQAVNTENCNEVDSYLNDIDEHGNILAEADIGPAAAIGDCEDMAHGNSAVEYTADAKAACADFIDAKETLDTCEAECSQTDVTDEYRTCIDDCRDDSHDYTPNEETICEQECPGGAEWICP